MTKNSTVRLTPQIMAAAMARMAPEGSYRQCQPFNCATQFTAVAELDGADFEAGDIAREAVERGFEPNRLVEFFIGELLPLARWLARPCLTHHQLKALPSGGRRGPDAIAEANARCKVLAFATIGIARSIVAGEIDLSDEDTQDWLTRLRTDADELTEMVEAADAVVSFAYDLAMDEDKAQAAEMSARGITRRLADANSWSAHRYDTAEMVERLRTFVGAAPKLPEPARAKPAKGARS